MVVVMRMVFKSLVHLDRGAIPRDSSLDVGTLPLGHWGCLLVMGMVVVVMSDDCGDEDGDDDYDDDDDWRSCMYVFMSM